MEDYLAKQLIDELRKINENLKDLIEIVNEKS
jgi:hypothetical protein